MRFAPKARSQPSLGIAPGIQIRDTSAESAFQLAHDSIPNVSLVDIKAVHACAAGRRDRARRHDFRAEKPREE